MIAGVDLTGRRAVVTGGASGIGVETARALAAAGAEVTLAVRNTAAGERTAADIIESTGNNHVFVAPIELADRASVAAFAAGWDGPLHILVNNAGVMAEPLNRTPEGWEHQFATNHLGHFGLALGLHDALAAAGDARIVSVSSSAHLRSDVHFDDIHFEHRPYEAWAAYGQSKTANVLFAVEAAKRWASDGIIANALMPGGIRTALQRHVDPDDVQKGVGQVPVEDHRAGCVDLGAAGRVAAGRRRHRPVLRGQQRGVARRRVTESRRCRGVRARSGVGHSVVGSLGETAGELTYPQV